MERQGQRLLLALTSPTEDADDGIDRFNYVAIVAGVGGVFFLIYVLVMCTCKDRSRKQEHEDLELQQGSKKGNKKSTGQMTPDNADTKSNSELENVVVNGGTVQGSNTMSGHSRQASSGSAHMRPTSLRELPAPPVSNPNKTISGVEQTGTSTKSAASGGGGAAAGSADYAYHQHPAHSRNGKNSTPSSISSGMEKEKSSQSDGYDHLGPKRSIKPTDYDSLVEPESTDGETPMSETSGGLDGHYSLLRERTYAVVVDVKAKAKELFDPYSKVKDKDDASSDYYSQVKEEDPYNLINDSGGTVTTSFIRQLRQSRDLHDTYSTVQESSRSEMKVTHESRGVSRGTLPHSANPPSSWNTNAPATAQNDVDGEEEYAVVQKSKGMAEQATESDRLLYSEGDISPYGMGPPEPPRLYNDYDSAEEAAASTTVTVYKKEHKYSKVTARESLASMSARNALNPYEMVMDIPENTYATVEGGSGDGFVLRGGSTSSTVEKRLSQTSDTYAEIGISGGGLSSSVISSSSSAGVNNNSSSSVAPIPPSLDSLHLMTKSQTSSEGDRLSDRHLASPEDSSMSLNIWGDSREDEDSEDGYSTLKKLECTPQNSSLPAIPDSCLITDEDSGEVTLVPNYQTVKDCISDNEAMEESENDPNYESVDEARAKVALLKARTALDSRTLPFSSLVGASGVSATSTNSAMGSSVDSSMGVKDELPKGGQRRRRLDHDYEEVDLSPPSSPISTPSSTNNSNSSSYHITSFPNTGSVAVSSHSNNDVLTDITDAREQAIQSHMYEELAEVRAKTSAMNKLKKGNAQAKNISEEKKKTGLHEKKKVEEKGKSSSQDKRKQTEDKRKSASEDKRKSAVDDKRKHIGDDKKKNSNDEKRKSTSDDKKKVGLHVANGTRL